NLDPAYTGQMNDTAHREDVVGGQYALYDFPAREYSVQGRWPNPDPAGVHATCPKNPQSQNRYAYVLGNPMTQVDPTGLFTLDCNNGENPFCAYCNAFPDDPACQNPCGFDFFDNPFCPLPLPPGGGGGGGGYGGGGGANPEKPRPFPWPLLPPGFFNQTSSGNGTGVATCALVVPSFRGLGCIYLCEGPKGIALAGKSCGPLDSKALKLCPFTTKWVLGVLISPPDFCGKTQP
ncbi:MAG: RHS repeat-associated core domain-containing protein, partial [Candidatus Acidiferrum sp.]